MTIPDLLTIDVPPEERIGHLSRRARSFLRVIERAQRAGSGFHKKRLYAQAVGRYVHLTGGDLGNLRNLGVRI